jgi:hypothetical protein
LNCGKTNRGKEDPKRDPSQKLRFGLGVFQGRVSLFPEHVVERRSEWNECRSVRGSLVVYMLSIRGVF